MRILITGASGFIGRHLVHALLEAGYEVCACVRRPHLVQQQWPEITVIEADFTTDHAMSDWTPRLQNVDVVINTVGIIRQNRHQTFDALHTQAPIALFQACESAGVKRVIQISALGADETAFSHYHTSKRAADRYLRDLSLDGVVVMPSIVYGAGAKSMALFKAMAALPWIPLIDIGDQEIQPIYIDDLTKAILQLIDSPSPLRVDIEMVGPVAISMKSLYMALRHWLGKGRASFFSLPYRAALYGACIGGFLGQTSITEEAVQMLRNGNTADVEPFISRFGFRPQSMAQVLAGTPAQQADRWHASLFFLAPLLRFTIAFVWLFTGIVSAFIFPVEQSYAMLAKVGFEGFWQPVMLYGAAATDMLLGIATLLSFRLRQVATIQIGIVLLYSIIITIWLPEHWFHPFGSVSKNLPLIVATLIMLVLERRR
ncbi:MAG: SDR family NAD(P)-dependent oxidoreductase [Candidatus Thiodiazotropha sp. (ex Myrtea sp. 'scaly one' KF741663)]|nr:SDR family NAD(P)-dependent oxidoreductase [Candidatus Thiodiazotropha sp. (ex Myrtea sp. 'scaly one' KF741663)]